MIAPERRQASTGAGEQLTLIDPPPFCPTYPKRGSLPWRALSMLLTGKLIDHGDFIESTESWRLAAAIHLLRKSGWPVETIDLPSPSHHCPTRVIAIYRFAEDCLAQAALLGEGKPDGQ
jgi:hypothetical protein